MQLPDGKAALGFRSLLGERLKPERIISNRPKLRFEMTEMLRAFAAALPDGEIHFGS